MRHKEGCTRVSAGSVCPGCGPEETVGQEEMPVGLEAGEYTSDDLDRIVAEADRKAGKLRHIDEVLPFV